MPETPKPDEKPTIPTQPPDEEITLGPGSARSKSQQNGAELDEKTGDDMGARHASLESEFGPGVTDAELIDTLLQLPEERLIPWEMCHIPSKGLFYGWQTETVEVHAMGQTAEKILATQRLAQTGQSVDYLFRECVRYPNPAFDSMEMLVGDRVFLLYYLRGITHGNMYEFAVTCQRPECGQVSTHTYDLNNLSRTIRWADSNLGPEPFKVTLPYLSECTGRDVWVGLRFLRGRDTNSMVAMRKTKKRLFATPAVRAGGERNNPFKRQTENIQIDDTLTENLQMVITSVLGVADRARINALVSRMHATDTAAIREWLRTNSPGIDTLVTLNCAECGQEFTVELPITESFFRPTQKRGD